MKTPVLNVFLGFDARISNDEAILMKLSAATDFGIEVM